MTDENNTAPAVSRDPDDNPERAPAGGGSGLALVAMIVALASAGIAGWLWWQNTQTRSQQSSLVTAQARELAALESQLADVRDALSGVDRLGTTVDETARQLGSDLTQIRQELTQLQTQLTERETGPAAPSEASRVLGEVESLLRIAGYQLRLRQDPRTAREALRSADRLLADLDDPATASLRATLAEDLRALESVPEVDLAGAAARLAALAKDAAQWPMRAPGEGQAGPAEDEQAATTADSSWRRLMQRMGRALRGLVRVQKHAENTTLFLLTPAEERLLRENLRLKFETARLALLQRRSDVYRDTLAEARDWLTTYFDDAAPGVGSALDQIENLMSVEPDPSLPELSGSLNAARRLRDELRQRETGP